MRRWAIDIWANRVRTIFVDGGCVDQGVSKTALQQKGLRKCMHWYVSCLFCRRTKQHVSRCMLTRTELFDASFASAFRPWTRISNFSFKTAAGSPKRPREQPPRQAPRKASKQALPDPVIGAILDPFEGTFWGHFLVLWARKPQNVWHKYLYSKIQSHKNETWQKENNAHRHTHKYETATRQKQN